MNSIKYEKKRPDKHERIVNRPAVNDFNELFDCPLRQVDIILAIQYYGITELLDHIGVAEIKRYLAD